MDFLKESEQKIWEFNRQAGRFTNVNKESLKEQIKLIREELDELEEAVEFNQPIEKLDGLCDIVVTALGFGQMLDAQDYIVYEALDAVADNNLSKRIWTEDDMAATQEKYNALGVEVVFDYDQISGSWMCKKVGSGKVMKPASFSSVNLKPYVPQEEL